MGHIEPILPFVSDLGVTPPEASLFSLFMNCGAILVLIFNFIRYESTKTYIQDNENTNDKQIIETHNKRSLISGLSMATGFLFVANFRNSEGYFVQTMHNIGAVFGFSSSVIDIYIQSKIAYELGHKNVARIRSIISGTCLLLVVGYVLLSICSFWLFPEALTDTNIRLKWNSDESGYNSHVIGTILEWILIFMLSPYFATFVSEFRRFEFSKQLIVYKDVNENITFRSLREDRNV